MPLFQCSKCDCVENTACCHYWSAVCLDKKEPLCSECDHAIGKWHDRFEKKSAIGMLIDQNGHLWSKKQIEAGFLPPHYKIIGEVKGSQNIDK